MELQQVKDLTLSNGTRYTGWGYIHNGEFIPNGCGKMFCKGYYIYGNFKQGVIDGPAIESHDMYMKTMQFKNGQGQGWGLCINCGQLAEFGYYENSELKTDLSDFALWYFNKMQNAGRNENMLSMYTFNANHNVCELLMGYKPTAVENGVGLVGMGFHFMADGSVWMGNTTTRCFSGDLIHFNSDGTVDCGVFENGTLSERLELQEIINYYYGTIELDKDDIFAESLCERAANPIRENFRNAQPIKIGYNYFEAEPNKVTSEDNKFSMIYTMMDVDFLANGHFVSLKDGEKEKWIIGDSQIITPHGILNIENASFVEDGMLVGVVFSVFGYLRMNDFSCSNGLEDDIQVSTFAIMRQPNNAWLWAYAFDEDNTPVANFCGTDLMGGLARFVPFLKRKFQRCGI